MTRHIAVVVNPTSGRGLGARLHDGVVRRLNDAGLRTSEYVTSCADDVGRIAASVLASGADGVALVGGDGTVHLAAQVLAGSRLPLGLVPAGTGNDFARSVGLPPMDPDAATDRIVRGGTRTVDLLRAGGTMITTVLAGGFDALVNARANRMPWPKGQARYKVATLAELRTFRPLRYVVTVDGRVTETEAMLVSVGNTATYGGGLRSAPVPSSTTGCWT